MSKAQSCCGAVFSGVRSRYVIVEGLRRQSALGPGARCFPIAKQGNGATLLSQVVSSSISQVGIFCSSMNAVPIIVFFFFFSLSSSYHRRSRMMLSSSPPPFFFFPFRLYLLLLLSRHGDACEIQPRSTGEVGGERRGPLNGPVLLRRDCFGDRRPLSEL